MLIGVPKEIKTHEYRVGLVPESVREVTGAGHSVIVEKNAGMGIGITDEDYRKAGAEVLATAQEIYTKAEMIVKVKEPQPSECKLLHKDQILFAYLHLAPDLQQAELLLTSGCTAIAYETVTDIYQHLPLLSPMSEVAGRMSVQVGAFCLEKTQGGSGVLLGGVPGVAPAKVVVIGGGFAGSNAIRVAVGMGAHVTLLDRSLEVLQELDLQFGASVNTIYATAASIEKYVIDADLVIGAVLVPGASAPKLVTRAMIKKMRPGSVVVDISIDQGGCFETSRPTTHAAPTYIEEGIVHYCVVNMPGAVARTAAFALNNVTLPFIIDIANKGAKQALLGNVHLLNGLNVHHGMITHQAVALALGKPYRSAQEALLL